MTLVTGASARIQLCGPTVVEVGGEAVGGPVTAGQGRLLFAYLVVNRHRVVGRDELVEALWPAGAPAAPDGAINVLISKLRKSLGPEALEGRSNLRLRLGAGSWIDVEAADEAVHRAESKNALGDHAGAWGPALAALFVSEREFLPGADGPWIDEHRRHLQQVHLWALEAYAHAALGVGGTELPAAVRTGRQLVKLAPLRETGYQVLMRSLAHQGNVAEALRVYTALCEHLREELGISPCAATQAVYEDLLRA